MENLPTQVPRDLFLDAASTQFPTGLNVPLPADLQRPENVTIRRPQHVAGDPKCPFYAFTEAKTTLVSDAVGVDVSKDEVDVCIASVNPVQSLGAEVFRSLYRFSRDVVFDFYGVIKKTTCRNGLNCPNVNCTFFHNRPGEDRELSRAVRVMPPGIAFADGHKGMSLRDDAPAHVALLRARFPRQGSTVRWESPIAIEFTSSGVGVADKWDDTKVELYSKQHLSSNNIDTPSAATDFFLIKCFCEFMSLGRGQTFEQAFGDLKDIVEDNTPCYQQGTFQRSTREVLSLRRFLTDTTFDYFNEQACKYLAQRSPDALLLCREFTIPRDAVPYIGSCRKKQIFELATQLPATLRMLTRGLPSVCTLRPAAQCVSTESIIVHTKFTAALRDFLSLHNLAVLTSVIDPTGNASSIELKPDVGLIEKRRAELQRREDIKMAFALQQQVPQKERPNTLGVYVDNFKKILCLAPLRVVSTSRGVYVQI